MPTIYEKADDEVGPVCVEMMKKYHGDLYKEGLRVDLLFASNSDGVAVKLHGYPCAAEAR